MPLAEAGFAIPSDIELANLSDIGCARSNNEDYFLYIESKCLDGSHRNRRLILVTDGMGGQNGGEVASRLAAETVRDVFLQRADLDERALLIDAFQTAHAAILDMAQRDSQLKGMGTTCSAIILTGNQLYIGHVGDSRIYLIRDGQLQQLTEDHNVAARLVRDGMISGEEARDRADRNVLTAAIGMESASASGDFPIDAIEIRPEDLILLCTDGLHSLVSDEELLFITSGESPSGACRDLVDLAKRRGGPDNITLQILEVRRVEA